MTGTEAPTPPAPRLLTGPDPSIGLAAPWRDRALALLTHAPTGSGADAAERRRLAPGAGTGEQDHHATESLLWVYQGRLRVVWGVDGSHALEAGPGDCVLIPARLRHDLQNPDPAAPVSYGLVQA